jgi:inosine/xanthosine triphosphate pyrophosphatase family protein
MTVKPRVIYCSGSPYKIEEWEMARTFEFEPGLAFGDLINLEFRKVATSEPLLRDLSELIYAKAISAYRVVKAPCLVEHAGIILADYKKENYPGGLTQAMWNALGGEKFVASCAPLGGKAVARAIIGYCDGANVHTFVGETEGTLRDKPAGRRQFDWDTIFCPDGYGGRTYAEIADDDLGEKLRISQSTKAFRQLISYCRGSDPQLFPGI